MNALQKILFSKKIGFLAVPTVAVSVASSYGIYRNVGFISETETNYLVRLNLDKFSSSAGENNKLLQEDTDRLISYYQKYDSSNVSVNLAKKSSKSEDSLFVHVRSFDQDKNTNRLWFEKVHLNQLSIDRYGHEYDKSTGQKKGDSSPKTHSIVKWENVSLENLSYIKPTQKNPLDSITLNFKNDSIKDEEVEILVNEDKGKYNLEEGQALSRD